MAREKWRKDNLKALNAQLRNGEEDQKVFDGGWHSKSGLSHSSSRHSGAENTSLRPPLTSAVLPSPRPTSRVQGLVWERRVYRQSVGVLLIGINRSLGIMYGVWFSVC